MRSRFSLITVTICLLAVPTVAYGQLPDRPASKVLDRTGTLSQATIDEIERIGREVNEATDGDIMVAILDTTGGKNPREFATELFNHWQIGNREKDNGVLVFAAMKDRKAEIILGDGLGNPPDFPQARDIMSDYMMPQFKRGNPDQGIRIAVEQAAARFFSVGDWGSPPAAPLKVRKSRKQSKRSELLKLALAVLGTGGVLGAGGVTWSMFRRRRTRYCANCQRAMVRLDEVADDAHLNEAESVEEQIGSVDYDVWLCLHCDEVQKLRYPAIFSSFAKCPRCKHKTASQASNTIEEATYASTGTREVVETCQHCEFSQTTSHIIPVITSTSSSSSGGSSFSGGSSSGGGASGSW